MEFTAALPRFFAEVFLLLLWLAALKKKWDRTPIFIGWVILILILRDAAVLFYPSEFLFPLSNLLLAAVYFLWVRSKTGFRNLDIAFFSFSAAVIVFIMLDMTLLNLAVSIFYIDLAVFAAMVYLALLLGVFSEFTSEKPEIVIRGRFAVIAVMLLYQVSVLLYGYSNELSVSLVMPASYLLHGYILYLYLGLASEEDQNTLDAFRGDVEALFEFMSSMGSAIAEKIDIPSILNIIVQSALRNTAADAGTALIVDKYEDKLNAEAIQGIYPPLSPVPDIASVNPTVLKDYFRSHSIPIGETVLGEVARTGEPLFIRDVINDGRMEFNSENNIFLISSIIAIPLIVSNRLLGVISVVKRAEDQYFSEQDLSRLQTLAEFASVTIDTLYTYMEVLEKRQIDREIGIAAQIQDKLIPKQLPELKVANFAFFSNPARGVSGDYFDLIELNAHKVGVVIGDVAGKGVPASLVMVMIHSILQLILNSEDEAYKVISWINRGITGKIDIDHYATLSFFTFDEKTREVVYSNAAHHPLLFYSKKMNKIYRVETRGLPIGIEKNSTYNQKRFTVEPGDLLILYTDGIVEAMNPEGVQYSRMSLERMIMQNNHLAARKLMDRIKTDLHEYTGREKPMDDQTLVVMKVT